MIRQVFEEKLPFWDDLNESDKTLVCDYSIVKSYKKDEVIHGGNECTGVILVNKGCIRLYILSDEGKEATLYRLYEGDICMLSASCVIQAITFDVHIDAEEETECYIINSGTFADISERNPKVKIFGLETAVTRFSDVMWTIQQILFMKVDKRLAIFLLDEIARTKSDFINLTHEQIAKLMGSAREVITRMLKYFTNEGIVELSRKGIRVIDKNKLRKLAL